MNRVILRCNAIINFTKSIDDIFSDKSANMEPEQEITIRPGESLRFSNGAALNLTTEELTNLMKITYPEDQKENEEPFTILFNSNVPKEVQEEVLRRVSSIYEEVSAEMGRGNGR